MMVGSDPFFSNDLEGIAKVLGLVATISAPILVFIWRVLKDPVITSNKATRAAVERLDERVKKVEERTEAAVRKAETAEQVAHSTTLEFSGVRDRLAKVEQSVENLREQGNVNKMEIIEAFQRRAGEMREGVHAVELSIAKLDARLQERQRVEDMRHVAG